MAGFFSKLFGKKKQETADSILQHGYRMMLDTAQVIKHNTLMNGITSARGEAMGFVQENWLDLKNDGVFELTKELKSTKTNLLMKIPVSVKYIFRGTYTQERNIVQLSAAVSGTGHVSWGTFSKFLDTGDGDYDSQTSPGILSLYPTAFYVENCKNVPMTVRLNETEHSFTIDAFEPVILSAEEAGKVEKKEQPLDPEAGLMKHLPVAGANPYCLKDTFAAKGLKVGTCINPDYIVSPYEEILLSQFSSVTLENHLKPAATLNQEKSMGTGRLSVLFSDETVRLLNWCKEHRMPLRGHTLIWYMGTPDWIFHEDFADDAPNVDRDTMLRRMEELISSFFAELSSGGWDEIMYCIDVVNEAVIAPDQMRKCPWHEIIGDDYVRHAYALARKYAPKHMKLAYNDFDLETKTDKVISMVNSLVDEQGVKLVDVIGQQGHYGAYSSIATLGEALKKIGQETGCEIQITELDVSVSRQGTEDELKTQGRFYFNFVQQVLALKDLGINITGITLWGFADALSWMPSGFLHLYDRNLTPKYAYYGMLGMKEYAGFDSTEDNTQSHFVCMKFIVKEDVTRCIQLNPDGTYTDTTTGAKQEGTYRSSDESHFMLLPKAGGYCNLSIQEDGFAERLEAAGNLVRLIRE